MFYAHAIICIYFSSYLPVKPELDALKAASPLLPVLNCQIAIV